MLGDGYCNAIVALAVGIGRGIQRKAAGLSLQIAAVSLSSGLIVDLLKVIVARPRPLDWHNLTSFPSGHSASIFALATVLALNYPRWRWVFWLVASLVGVSRVVVGAHYPLDVLAGSAIGFGTASLYFAVLRRGKRAVAA